VVVVVVAAVVAVVVVKASFAYLLLLPPKLWSAMSFSLELTYETRLKHYNTQNH
jgi:hypothetical protein